MMGKVNEVSPERWLSRTGRSCDLDPAYEWVAVPMFASCRVCRSNPSS